MTTVPTFLFVTLSRCTIQKECAQGLLARSWISMGEGPQQCPSMTLTPPEISIAADIKVKLPQYYSGPSHPFYKSHRMYSCKSHVCNGDSVFKAHDRPL